MADSTDGAGSGRTAEVADPAFVEGLDSLDLDELRRRRDVALAEREYRSYLRRLVQTRLDVLRGERDRRSAGDPSQAAVDRVKDALVDSPRGASRGEALRVVLSGDDLARAEREAEELTGTSMTGSLEDLSDDALATEIAAAEEAEQRISADRTAVLRVNDRLSEELTRRYRQDPSLIQTEF